jgi:hypothetical protein
MSVFKLLCQYKKLRLIFKELPSTEYRLPNTVQ